MTSSDSPSATSTGTTTDASAGSASDGPDTVSTKPRRRGRTETTTASGDAEVTRSTNVPGDAYCGNCSQFRYVRTEDGLQPYCGLHEEVMDDMDACAQWEPNT